MRSVVDRLREGAAGFAARPAIVDGARTVTHAELWERVDRLSAGLRAMGVEPGDRLMAWLPNRAEAIEAEMAALQAGIVWVSLSARLPWAEIAELIQATEPRALLVDADGLRKMGDEVRAMQAARREGPILIHCGERAGKEGGAQDYEALIGRSEAGRPEIDLDPEAPARLRYTSGTMGRAKLAVLAHRVYHASLDNLRAELHELGPEDRALHAGPLTHASGALAFPILAAGGANVVHRKFDARAVLESIESDRITTMFVVPTMLARMAAEAGFATLDLSGLKTVMYGGAPMPAETLEAAIDRIGPALVHIYGMTEAPYPIATLGREEHRRGNARLGSIGRPTAICRARIVDDGGREAAAGATGELQVAGPNIMSGYWRDEAATRSAMDGEWLRTGDLARRDGEGFLTIVGRAKDVIISGGFNVGAREVELALEAHPAVAEAAVAGLPDPDWGERVVAWVVAEGDRAIDAEEARRWCRARLADYACPKEYRFVRALPRTISGKVRKWKLTGEEPSPSRRERDRIAEAGQVRRARGAD